MPIKALYVARADGYWWAGATKGPQQNIPTPPFTVDATQPTQANTGINVTGLSNSDLTLHTGDWTISANNTTIDGYLIRGLVTVTGSNVTIRNCKIVSRTVSSSSQFAVVQSSGSGFVIQNTEVSCYDDTQTPAKDNTSYIINGGVKITGGSATISRCDIHDVIDGIYITAGTVEATGNHVHSLCFRTDDANQAGSSPAYWSHNDGVQVMGGSNHNLHGNNIDMAYSTVTGSGSVNSEMVNDHGMLIQASGSAVTGVKIDKNWFSYGVICVLFSGKVTGSTASMNGNRFTPNQGQQFSTYQQMANDPNTQWTVTGTASNVYSDDADTPLAWRGVAIKPPSTSGTTTHWWFNQSAHTP